MISRLKLYLLSWILLLAFSSECFAGFAGVSDDGKVAIASVNPIATQAGFDAIKKGGNAIDAALAVAFTLGVVDGQNSGIGGGCFIMVHLANGKILAIDGREMAAAKASHDMYLVNGEVDPELSKTGALAVGIPGSVQALYELQQRAGKLTFADVVLPAADLAERGFPVSKVFAARLASTADKLKQFPQSANIFLPKGKLLKQGDTLVQKDLAHTYRQLAKLGPNYFYRGEFAKLTEQWMKANGGIITAKDFANYHTVYRDPIHSTFLGYDIYGFPPPSSGGVHVAQVLNILELYQKQKLSEVDQYHLMIEALKLAFADRAYWLGDPDFVGVPKGLIDKSYAKTLAEKISMDKAARVIGPGVPPEAESRLFDRHTTHLATADADRNWVAMTTTLNTSFGSKVVVPGTGVLLNNQMDDFAAQPGASNAYGLVGSERNSIAPGKRPLSSMSPTLVMKDGKMLMSAGAAGGPTIISQVVQTLYAHLALNLPLDQAMKRVRVHHQWRPDIVFIDPYADADLRKQLEARGHEIRDWPPFGATQAISIKSGKFVAESEPRIQDDH